MNSNNKLKPYDLVLASFITEIRKAFERRIYGMIALLSGGKGVAVNETAIDFLPHLNSLYIMYAHGISMDTSFKDIAVNKEQILELFQHMDKVRDGIYASAAKHSSGQNREITLEQEQELDKNLDQLLTNLKPLGEA